MNGYPAQSQEADAATAKPAEPSTTGNPAIPTDHLKLLLKPLTKEDLVVEADGWRELLRDCI